MQIPGFSGFPLVLTTMKQIYILVKGYENTKFDKNTKPKYQTWDSFPKNKMKYIKQQIRVLKWAYLWFHISLLNLKNVFEFSTEMLITSFQYVF